MDRFHHARAGSRSPLVLTLAFFFAAAPLAAQALVRAPDPRQARDQQQQEQEQEQEQRDPEERVAGEGLPEDGFRRHSRATTLMLTPSRFEAGVGDRVRLTLSALGAHDLRRLPLTVRFDPQVLRLVSVELGDAWSERPQPAFLHDASRAGELVVGLAQMNRDDPGMFGTVELIELEFEAIGTGDAGLKLDRYAAITDGTTVRDTEALPAEIIVK